MGVSTIASAAIIFHTAYTVILDRNAFAAGLVCGLFGSRLGSHCRLLRDRKRE